MRARIRSLIRLLRFWLGIPIRLGRRRWSARRAVLTGCVFYIFMCLCCSSPLLVSRIQLSQKTQQPVIDGDGQAAVPDVPPTPIAGWEEPVPLAFRSMHRLPAIACNTGQKLYPYIYWFDSNLESMTILVYNRQDATPENAVRLKDGDVITVQWCGMVFDVGTITIARYGNEIRASVNLYKNSEMVPDPGLTTPEPLKTKIPTPLPITPKPPARTPTPTNTPKPRK
jgi:hypothetical protein